jgi:hypothetical protein
MMRTNFNNNNNGNNYYTVQVVRVEVVGARDRLLKIYNIG